MPRPNTRQTTPRLRPLLLVLSLITAAGSAGAQSLKDLYDAAAGYDASVIAARAQADSAQYTLARIQASRRPTVNVRVTATQSETDPVTGSRTIGGSNQQASIIARHPLFNRPISVTVDQAELSYAISKAVLDLAEQDLIIRVSQAYFDVLAAQDVLATARANRTAISEQLASAKRNFEVGTSTITDTREAQARFDLATSQELAAENDLRVKRIALDQQVGRANVEPRPLAMPVALPPLGPTDAEEWVARADGQHPSIRRARLEYDIAKLETAKARAGHLPTVDLTGSIASSRSSGTAALLSNSQGVQSNLSLGIELNYVLYAGNSIQNRIRETTALEEKARNDLETVRRSIAQNTRQAFFSTQSLQAQAKALEAAEASSKLALEATQLGYRVGVRVNLDVLNAQTQLFSAQRDLSKARYDAIVTSLRLRQAAGQLQPQDVQAVDALLAR